MAFRYAICLDFTHKSNGEWVTTNGPDLVWHSALCGFAPEFSPGPTTFDSGRQNDCHFLDNVACQYYCSIAYLGFCGSPH